jgi:uncharacterized membrane protein
MLMLGFCSFACCIALLGRRVYTGEGDCRFLIWNLFLAWIPFVAATAAHAVYAAASLRNRTAWLWTLLMVWLLFFPNAPYLISDLKHLREPHRDTPIWFDAILLGSFALTGELTGFASLLLVHDLIRRQIGSPGAWVVLVTAAFCSGEQSW